MGGLTTGLLESLSKVFSGRRNRRKQPRFAVSKGAFVLVGPRVHNRRKVQIVDVSMGGLAFIYDGSVKDLKDSGMLSLLVDDKVYLDSVHYEAVADHPLPTDGERERDLRKKSVKFNWLGCLDKNDLQRFIEDISLGEI